MTLRYATISMFECSEHERQRKNKTFVLYEDFENDNIVLVVRFKLKIKHRQ